MSNKDFIEKIIQSYVDSRELSYGNGGYNITRGMSHSSSGKAEDLFALFVANYLDDNDLKFLVDKPISANISTQKRKKTFKPDLAIEQNNQLTHYFDLKMDLGWNRDIEHYLYVKNNFINELKKSKTASYKILGGKKEIQIADALIYQIVILTPKNGNAKALRKNIEVAKKLENVKLYILTEGVHLNFYNPKERESLIIRDDQFEKLLQDTKQKLI